MALINRISRLFTADVHAVLDRIEEPDVLLRHAIREMEEELVRTEQRVRSAEQECALLEDRSGKIRATLSDLAGQLDVCFADDNDVLARKVIKRRLETEKLEAQVAERRAALEEELKTRREALTAQREELDVVRQKAELLTGTPRGCAAAMPEFAVGDDEIEVAFLRERQKRQPS